MSKVLNINKFFSQLDYLKNILLMICKISNLQYQPVLQVGKQNTCSYTTEVYCHKL